MYHIVVIWFITLDREKYTLSYDILHGIVSQKSEKNKNGPPRLLSVLKTFLWLADFASIIYVRGRFKQHFYGIINTAISVMAFDGYVY